MKLVREASYIPPTSASMTTTTTTPLPPNGDMNKVNAAAAIALMVTLVILGIILNVFVVMVCHGLYVCCFGRQGVCTPHEDSIEESSEGTINSEQFIVMDTKEASV